MFQLILRCWHNEVEKCEVNQGSRLDMIFEGIPNHLYMLFSYSSAIPSTVMFVVQGRKMATLVQPWSTMVRMALWP